MTNYEKYLEEKDLLESLYPPDYPPELIEWLNSINDYGYKLLELKKVEGKHSNYFRVYATSGYPALIIVECVADKDGKRCRKFQQVWTDVLAVQRAVERIVEENKK